MTAISVSEGDERTQEFPALTRTMFVKYAGASGDFNFAVVPEPSTYAGILAVLALSFAVWRRHRTA